jgi:hypothetical protein
MTMPERAREPLRRQAVRLNHRRGASWDALNASLGASVVLIPSQPSALVHIRAWTRLSNQNSTLKMFAEVT